MLKSKTIILLTTLAVGLIILEVVSSHFITGDIRICYGYVTCGIFFGIAFGLMNIYGLVGGILLFFGIQYILKSPIKKEKDHRRSTYSRILPHNAKVRGIIFICLGILLIIYQIQFTNGYGNDSNLALDRARGIDFKLYLPPETDYEMVTYDNMYKDDPHQFFTFQIQSNDPNLDTDVYEFNNHLFIKNNNYCGPLNPKLTNTGNCVLKFTTPLGREVYVSGDQPPSKVNKKLSKDAFFTIGNTRIAILGGGDFSDQKLVEIVDSFQYVPATEIKYKEKLL